MSIYEPGVALSNDPEELRRFVDEELRRIATAINDRLDLDTISDLPAKPQEGMIRYLDGVNTGTSEGPHVYLNGLWVPLAMSDFALEVSKGNISGHAEMNKFGNNPALGSGATETVWDGSNAYTFPATADMTHLRQAADQATMRGEVIELKGLDTNYALSTQNITLDGTNSSTPVALDTPLRRCFRMKALSSVVTTQNVELRNVGGGTTYAIITAGNNQTLMAIYTVPADKTAYMTQYYVDCNKVSGGGDPEILAKLWVRDNENGYAPQIKHIIGTDSDATSHIAHPFNPYFKITEKSDIYLNATEITGGGGVVADVSAGFDLIVVDN